jgi:hypothetical protein
MFDYYRYSRQLHPGFHESQGCVANAVIARRAGWGRAQGVLSTEGDVMDQDQREASQDERQEEIKKTPDMGGRRKKADRRQRTTAGTFPERRWLRHRRGGGDRRSFPFFSPRRNRERRNAFRDSDPEEKA